MQQAGVYMKRLFLVTILFFATATGLNAQEMDVLEAGDPQEGLVYVKEVCANCHAISGGESPELDATSLVEIANVPGMSAEALLVWMNTLHEKMPNISLEREELADVAAYILSLRTEPDQRKLMAEQVDLGDPKAGLAYAKETCSGCHGISGEKSPVPWATTFSEIANIEGMSANALLIWMNVLHPTMPNITPNRNDLKNVIAYIVSQKDSGRSKNP